MSPQLRVFLTPSDTKQLHAELLGVGPFTILKEQSAAPRPVVVTDLALTHAGDEVLTVFLARDDDLEQVVMRPIPGTNAWRVDSIPSPVIEFSRPFFNGRQMRAGRFFYQAGYYVGDDWRTKSDGFVRWAKRVFTVCRRVLSRDAETGGYWGSEAVALRDAATPMLLPT